MERGTFAALGAPVAVVAEGTADFDEWLARQAVPSVTPTHPELREGRAAFFRASCDGCHTIRGTAARGIAGPDLTHVSTRPSMNADSLGTHLRTVAGARARRPAPAAHPQAELRAIAAYLASLK
jgi:cytochrome c oxidase subunit II